MSSRSRKLRHPSMQMTIEPAMKRFQMKRETKKPLCWIWYIFVFTHKRSSPEIHRVFLFPRMIEHLSGLPALMRSKHLAEGSESITRPLFSKSWTPRDRWEGDRGIKYVLIVNRSQMSWSRLASRQKLLWPPASITRSWRRASKELSREHEINHHKRYLGMHARHRKASNYRRRNPAMILSWYLGNTRACPRNPPNRLLPLSMQPQEQHPCCHCCYHHQK